MVQSDFKIKTNAVVTCGGKTPDLPDEFLNKSDSA